MWFKRSSGLALLVAGLLATGAAWADGGSPPPAASQGPQDPAPTAPSGGKLSAWQKAGVIALDVIDVCAKLHEVKGPPGYNVPESSAADDLDKANEAGETMQDLVEDLKEYGPDLVEAVRNWRRGSTTSEQPTAGPSDSAGSNDSTAFKYSPGNSPAAASPGRRLPSS